MFALSNLTIIWPILFAMVAIVFYRFILRPYLLLLYYKRQGAATFFYPELGSFPLCMRNALKYGDFNRHYRTDAKFIAENFGSQVHLVINDTDMLKECLHKYDIYEKDTGLLSLMVEIIKHSFPFENGTVFKNKRKRFTSSFHFECLKEFVPVIAESVQGQFKEWIKEDELTNAVLTDKMTTIAAEITGLFCFGSGFSKKTIGGRPIGVTVQNISNALMLETVSVPLLLFGPKFFKAGILPSHRRLGKQLQEVKDHCKKLIKEIEASPKRGKNLVANLLEAREKEKIEDRISDDEIVGEFMGFFATGVETPTFLLSSSVYFLWKYPHIYAKLKEEVDRELSDLSKIDMDCLHRLEYTTAYLKETMRLGGPNSILATRMTAKDDVLCGVKVKKGTLLNTALDLFFTSEKFYTNAREFVPERWLPNSSEYSTYKNDLSKTDSYSFIPFGAGTRNCIAQHLAMIEAKIFLALFVKTFTVTFPKDYELILVQRSSFQPLHPLIATFEVRK